VLFGGGAMVLAPLILRGKQPARIITWVLCGLVICCQGAGLASSGMSGASFGQTNTQGVDAEELQRRLTEGVPDWVRPAELASGGLMVVLALVVVIMLALPASHPFFRKQPPEQQWTPPAYPTV
jgi:xanthine/uracil permease